MKMEDNAFIIIATCRRMRSKATLPINDIKGHCIIGHKFVIIRVRFCRDYEIFMADFHGNFNNVIVICCF